MTELLRNGLLRFIWATANGHVIICFSRCADRWPAAGHRPVARLFPALPAVIGNYDR
jgi:hypothetical protein